MKQCPNCKTTYTDETLVYCLTDGAPLTPLSPSGENTVSMPASEETIAFGRNPMRVNLPGSGENESVNTVISPASPPAQPPPAMITERRGVSPAIVVVLAGLLLLVLIGFGALAAYVFLKSEPKPNDNRDVVTLTPTPVKNPDNKNGDDKENVNDEDLKDKLKNLDKKIGNTETEREKTDTPENLPTPEQSGTTARVNSPRDGFLALRSDPDTETGYRITKIPHGSAVRVIGCQGYSYVGKTRGRWCRIVYGGQAGWAFDAFLSF